MKKILLIATIIGATLFGLTGCTAQQSARYSGGSMTLKLEPNQKLEEITWKNNSLWYLTRPMTEDDIPETHTFQESDAYGFAEGTVTIVETKK